MEHAPAANDGDDLPSHVPVPPEPRSPTWLPIVGVLLLGTGLVWWLSTPAEEPKKKDASAESASASGSGVRTPESASASMPGVVPGPPPSQHIMLPATKLPRPPVPPP